MLIEFLFISLIEKLKVRCTNRRLWVRVPGEAQEAKVFPGEDSLDVLSSRGQNFLSFVIFLAWCE